MDISHTPTASSSAEDRLEDSPATNPFADALRAICGTKKAEQTCHAGAEEIERLERALTIARGVKRADEQMVRNDERQRLSALIEENAETLGKFASDPVAAVRLVALMIGLRHE